MVWPLKFQVLIAAAFFASPSLALGTDSADICQTRDDKADAAALDHFLVATLREHQVYGFSRVMKANVRAQAKSYAEQRLTDKRAELCAARLKTAEDVKVAPGRYATADCGSAAVVELLDQYFTKVSSTYEQNRQQLNALLGGHVKDIKLKLYDIARGAAIGGDINYKGYPLASMPNEIKLEWFKGEATKLVGEAQLAWGAAGPASNPLIQRNLAFAREALRAKQERDATKARLHVEGKAPAACKAK